eukprot:9550710-Alexandrium_andersonii.AAC.1
MSASLVGSEMCIRDRRPPPAGTCRRGERRGRRRARSVGAGPAWGAACRPPGTAARRPRPAQPR